MVSGAGATAVVCESCCAVAVTAVARRPIAALRVVVVVRWYYMASVSLFGHYFGNHS